MRKLLIAAAALGAAIAPVSAFATPVPIQPSPTLTVAGATFSNFTCSLTGNGFPQGCGQINVGANPFANGIEFTSGWTALPLEFTDAALTYRVSDATGITGIDLSFNGTFLGLAISSVTERVFDPVTNTLVGSATVSCSLFNCRQTDPATGYIPLKGGSYTKLIVEKDIDVAAAFGVAQISIIDQGFHTVPEPASLALLGAGLVGLGTVRRKRA